MSPTLRGLLNEDGSELADTALPAVDAGQSALRDSDQRGELGLRESQVLVPTLQSAESGALASGGTLCPSIHVPDINMSRVRVKDVHAPIEDVTAREERASKRYIQLIEELGNEGEGRIHGWQTRVARQVNIDQSYISRLARKEKIAPRANAIERAITALKLRPEFFYGVPEPRSYHDYTFGNEPVFQGWIEFRADHLGRSITPEERTALTSLVLPDGWDPTKGFYDGMLLNLRNLITKKEMERGVQKANELDEKLARKRRPKG